MFKVKEKVNKLVSDVKKRRDEIHLNYGKDRYLNLIDRDLETRFRLMEKQYRAALCGNHDWKVLRTGQGMLRAFDILEKNIKKNGFKKVSGHVWSYNYHDKIYLIVLDEQYHPLAERMARKETPSPIVLQLQELFDFIPQESWHFILQSKSLFPGSNLSRKKISSNE